MNKGYLIEKNKVGYPSYSKINLGSSFKKTPPKNVFTKTPPKKPVMGTFSAKQSMKTISLYETRAKSRKVNRNLTIEMINKCGSQVDNAEERSLTPRNPKIGQDQYFGRSLQKIAQIQSHQHANKINEQLNEVLNMIKEQKLKINEKMKILKRTNEHYRRLCEAYKIETQDSSTNTMDFLEPPSQRILTNQSTQIDQQMNKEQQNNRQEQIDRQKRQRQTQTYMKLYGMLQDMGINYKTILPEAQVQIVHSQQKRYKTLTENEIIKVQRFFIQKLVSKIPK